MVTINQTQRDALHRMIMLHMNGAETVAYLIDSGKPERARDVWRKLNAEARLLDDLGWPIATARDRFELTMPGDELAPLLRRLRGDAEDALRDYAANLFSGFARLRSRYSISDDEIEELSEEARVELDEDLDVLSACRTALVKLGEGR